MTNINNHIKLKIHKLEHAADLPLPNYATQHSSGMDLISANTDIILIKSQEVKLIPTGIAIALPEGFEAQIRPRSGLALKHGITVLNTPGTIDADYRGEIQVILINHGKELFKIERGIRIAQMIITRYTKVELELVDNLDNTLRGKGGFGSTGK